MRRITTIEEDIGKGAVNRIRPTYESSIIVSFSYYIFNNVVCFVNRFPIVLPVSF